MTAERKSLTSDEYDALPEVLTAAQVAPLLGVRPAQVMRWANTGILPGRRIGRQWRFSKSRLEAYMRGGSDRDGGEPTDR